MKITDARKKVTDNPLDSEAVRDLGFAYATRGALGIGIDFVSQAVASDSSNPSLHSTLGLLLLQAERYAESACANRQALEIDPQHLPALNGLGAIALQRHDAELAVAFFRRTVALAPEDEPSRSNLATGLNYLRNFAGALEEARAALKLAPGSANAKLQSVCALGGLGRFQAALCVVQELLICDPTSMDARHFFLQLLNGMNFKSKTAVLAQEWLATAPNDAILHFELGVSALATGDWDTGWREYEWRFRLPGQRIDHLRFAKPLTGAAWRGENLTDKTLLVHCEQGLGDTIQFLRFLPPLEKDNCRLIALVQPELVTLCDCLKGNIRVLPFRAPNSPHHYQIPLHSVPRVLGTTLKTIPRRVPYLTAPPRVLPEAVQTPPGALCVAFFWATRELSWTDHRNVPLSYFESLFELNQVHFYSLQINKSAAELASYQNRTNVHTLKPYINDMRDTAGFIMNMDLVITIDSAVAHLAGALGAKVWVLLPPCASCRWLKRAPQSPWNDRSPWYPTMRLFRSATVNGWATVIREVRDELAAMIENRGLQKTSPPPRVPFLLPSL